MKSQRRPSLDLDTVLIPTGSAYFDSEHGQYCGPMLGDGIRELIFEASLYPEDRPATASRRGKRH